MYRHSQKRWFMLTLPGLMLVAAFLIGGGAELLLAELPGAAVAQAAGSQPHTDCVGQHRGASFGGSVEVAGGEAICGELTSFGGSIRVRGEVNGDVVTFGGNVVIEGVVNGNVTLYGGNLSLLNGAHVNGDIHVCGGSWKEGTATELHGSTFECTRSLGALLTSDMGANFRLWSTLTWIVLGLLLTTLLPEHVMLVRVTAKGKTRRSFLLGILTILLAPVILAVLVALIIAIPLAILIAVGLIAAWALGMVAVGWVIGDRIVRIMAPQQNTRFIQVVVGMTVLALAGSLPYIGLLVSLGAGLPGLGAVFLSRFGTRLYTQPKQPLPL